ncbi:hypothetical protein ACFW1A_00710 [Kitasatospora sp. NPDC058965]|uniref:hypothetical protein n=1 Tax=Kitasatospora sp. NPDC058965 TaxID=3346682 RepID=UPI003694299B
MARKRAPEPKIRPSRRTNKGSGGTDPEKRTSTEKRLVPEHSPFQNGPRYVCRSGRYPDGTLAWPPLPEPTRLPAPTTPLNPWPPVRRQDDRRIAA